MLDETRCLVPLLWPAKQLKLCQGTEHITKPSFTGQAYFGRTSAEMMNIHPSPQEAGWLPQVNSLWSPDWFFFNFRKSKYILFVF